MSSFSKMTSLKVLLKFVQKDVIFFQDDIFEGVVKACAERCHLGKR
jgi:hypothetical protein